MMNKKNFMLLAIAAVVCSCGQQKQEKPESALMQHEAQIDTIISQMTLEEKIEMLHGKNMFSSAGVPRLGIADLEYADGPFGIREEMEPHSWKSIGLTTDSATFFPTGSALAATWSPELAYEYGKGMAKEAKLRGKDMILGPAINIQRIPIGGRTYEYMSEDPELSSQLAVGYTKGSQDNGVAVCLKHYALNNQENNRGTVDVKVSPRAMHEIYLAPFEAAVIEGDAWGVMSAYNKVNGKWCAENPVLLTDILRDKWGFKGIVISDWGGTHSSVESAQAGLNVEMPGSQFMGQALLDSVKAGAIDESVIDQRVRELLRVRLAVAPVPADQANTVMTSQPEQQKIAYDVAAKSIVLLKNDNATLPVNTSKTKKIAVIGDNAIAKQALGGIGAGVKALYEVTPLEGLKNRLAGSDVELTYAQGYRNYGMMDFFTGQSFVQDADPALLAEAVETAKNADLVIFVGGDNRQVETEGSDRKSITLPMGQDQVLEAIAAVNPNIVSVIVAGAPTDMRTVQKLSPAIVLSWFNGTEGGNALADVLLGNISPSGHLPFTLPLQLADTPAIKIGSYNPDAYKKGDIFVALVDNKDSDISDGDIADYTDDIFVGYRWYEANEAPVLYPFGHGLSYGNFEYSDLSVKPGKEAFAVEFTLANTGNAAAEEVAQIYVGRPQSQIARPAKELKAFKRIALQPGESQRVKIEILYDKLRHFDEEANDFSIEPGPADIYVGASSADIRLTDSTIIK